MNIKGVFFFVLTAYFCCHGVSCFSQNDVIFTKKGKQITCRVKEITLDVIKYERVDVIKGPLIEISKNDCYKVIFKHGAVEVIDPDFIRPQVDTSACTSLYITYNSGQSTQVFPVVINGKYICKLNNHSRMIYKSCGNSDLIICRSPSHGKTICRNIEVLPGNTYAIRIEVKNEQAIDPSDRFSMTLLQDSYSVTKFIVNEYDKMKPFKKDDHFFTDGSTN